MRAPRRPTTKRRPIHAAAAASLLPIALSLLPTTAGPPANANCGVHCGVERWRAKTLSDPGASNINMTPQEVTVSDLVAKAAPGGSEARVPPVETQAVTVHANLLGYKTEGDHDLHIVIEDPQTRDTMIVEIPDPLCAGVCSSIARDLIVQSRTTFETAFAASPPSSTFEGLARPVPIVVTGIPLFDFEHPTRQTGLAKNCIEVHPVLRITIPTDLPLTTVRNKTPKAPAGIQYHCMPRVSSTD